MRCIILADEPGWEALFEDKEAFVEIVTETSFEAFCQQQGDAYFDLREEAWEFPEKPFSNPLFVAGVVGTLHQHKAAENVVRLNYWPGMLERKTLECVGDKKIQTEAETILKALNKTAEWLPDLPGMVSPRVLSMIINEAWFAWGEKISSKQDIDTAMKLGTNYPMGPFEWGEKIGLHRVCHLLSELSTESTRYNIAPSLLIEVGL